MHALRFTTLGLCVGLGVWLLGFRDENSAYAQAVQALRQAETISWTNTAYMRATSQDRERTWLHTQVTDYFYRHPGQLRTVHRTLSGAIHAIEIMDPLSGREIRLLPNEKRAVVRTFQPGGDGQRPFDWVEPALAASSLELIGQRDVDGRQANVFRRVTPPSHPQASTATDEFWIDAENKQLLQVRRSNAEPLSPETAPDRDHPAEQRWWGLHALGSIDSRIAINLALEDELFSTAVPAGYAEEQAPPPPTYAESDLIALLGTAARFNGGSFPGDLSGLLLDQDQYNAAVLKPKTERTALDLEAIDVFQKYVLGQPPLLPAFRETVAVPDTFRYIGKGVTYGDATRIVCWYKLAATGRYRAMYGDASIRDIDPATLPLKTE